MIHLFGFGINVVSIYVQHQIVVSIPVTVLCVFIPSPNMFKMLLKAANPAALCSCLALMFAFYSNMDHPGQIS